MQFLLFFSPAKVSHFCTIFLGYYYILKIRSEFCIVNWCLCKNQWLLFLFFLINENCTFKHPFCWQL
jgi:hypothetical protein